MVVHGKAVAHGNLGWRGLDGCDRLVGALDRRDQARGHQACCSCKDVKESFVEIEFFMMKYKVPGKNGMTLNVNTSMFARLKLISFSQ